MRSLLRFVLLLVVIALVALSYLGFVPVLSSIFGANQPRDLGVTWTPDDLASARAKTGVTLVTLSVGATPGISYEGSRPVMQQFTSAEITALLTSANWRDNPLKDAQVKIGADGTIEGSAVLLLDKLPGYAEATGIDSGTVRKLIDQVDWLQGNPAVYFRATASVADDKLTGQVLEVQLGKFSVPQGLVDKYEDDARRFLEERFDRIPGLRADSVRFADGQMTFSGTLPAVERTAP